MSRDNPDGGGVGRDRRGPLLLDMGFYARYFSGHDSLFTAIDFVPILQVRKMRPGGTGPSSEAGRWGCWGSQAPKCLHRRPLASCVWRNLWLPFPPPELFLSRVQYFPEPGAPRPSPNSSLGAVSRLALPTSEARASMELAWAQKKQHWTL